MRRGFKAEAERLSHTLRVDLGISLTDALKTREFLRSEGIIVWEPKDIPGVDPIHVHQLTIVDPDSWSGCTVKENGFVGVIINPTHPTTRQANTLMHEWSHIKLKHKPNRVDRSENGLLLLSDYPKEIEEEADWLAGTILAPREGLVALRKQGMNVENVAKNYGISKELTNWRLRMTGVEKQLRNSR